MLNLFTEVTQSDGACLLAEDNNWETLTIGFNRKSRGGFPEGVNAKRTRWAHHATRRRAKVNGRFPKAFLPLARDWAGVNRRRLDRRPIRVYGATLGRA